jgi:hypothetical protein
MVDVSSDADLCVIPSDSSDPRKAGASSNRLLSALALGLPTAATPIPSYAEFSDYFVDIKSDPFSLSEPELSGLCALIKLAQANILEQYSREAVGRQWTNLFGL